MRGCDGRLGEERLVRRSSTSDGGSDEAIQTWFGTVLRARSVYAFASLKLRRTLLWPHGLRMAAPRLAGKGEAWWGRKDSHLRSHEAADLQSGRRGGHPRTNQDIKSAVRPNNPCFI